ncbi:glycoside hydrolase superfamily [Umbelopsis sp. AD052]|nr:glycoside hydrolase superfamily [Umbelopsis sp. AD052]
MQTYGFITASLLLCAGVLAQQQVTVNLPSSSGNVKVPNHFHGFSMELTSMNEYFGSDENHRDPVFMQLLRNVRDRTGSLLLRVGGNSQDTAYPDENIQSAIEKTKVVAPRINSGATTFDVKVSKKLFDVMNGVSSATGAKWMYGLNFEDASNMDSAKYLGQAAVETLGDHLFAIQIGNEPDLYAKHGVRTPEWGIPQYVDEWTSWASTLHEQFAPALKKQDIFTGAVICCNWNVSDIMQSNFMSNGNNMNYLNSITVQKYSSNNCFGKAKGDYTDYLNHEWIIKNPKALYTDSAKTINAAGKQLIMGETNTAACGGIPGVSDTFVSALWAVDWILYLASIGFSSVSLQIGGKTTLYNPMYNIDSAWEVAPIYYSSLAISEAVGKDKQAQFENIDLGSSTLSSYGVFHDNAFKYAVLLNTDINQDATYILKGGWSSMPSEVKVKRLLASNYEEKQNITWGGQTFSGSFDGQLKGDLKLETIKCDVDSCTIKLPPTSVAFVGADIDGVDPTSILDETTSSINNSSSAPSGTGNNVVTGSSDAVPVSRKASIVVATALCGIVGAFLTNFM